MGPGAVIRRWLARPRAVLLCTAALVVAGAWAATRLPVEWAPSIELPTLTIGAAWPGTPARVVERRVTAPIERALRGIPGTVSVESSSREGQALLRLSVSRERDLGLYVAEVSDRLAALRPSLPEFVVPRLTHDVPEAFRDEQGFMVLQVVGSISPTALRRLAEETLAPRLRGLPGVSGISLEGGEVRELLVTLDRDRLLQHRLGLETVRRTLVESFANRSYGWLPERGGQRLLLQNGEEDPEAVSRLVVGVSAATGALLRLSDVAQVSLRPAPVASLARVDGKPVVTLRIDRAPGSHLIEVAGRVHAALGPLRTALPPGVSVLVADDQSEDVREGLRDLSIQGLLGALAVIAALLLTLRSLRAVGIVLATVVVALTFSFLLMGPLGLTVNLLTLAGLTLLLGLLVNNGTVVVEQLLVRKARGGTRAGYAALAGRTLRDVWVPLLGCTATTAAILLPMLYLSGELRSLFVPFAVMAAATLAFSLLASLGLVPVLGRSLREGGRPSRRRIWRGLVLAPYAWAAAHPGIALGVLFLAVGLPTSLLPDRKEEPREGWASLEEAREAERYNRTLGSDPVRHLRRVLDPLLGGVTRPFLEEVELGRNLELRNRPEVRVWIRLPTGSGIERADEMIRVFEAEALRSPVVHRTLAWTQEDAALLRVQFTEDAFRTEEPYAVRTRLVGHALQISGAEISILGLVPLGFSTGRGDAANLAIYAYGPSYETLEQVAAEFARRLSRDPRVAEVNIDAGRNRQLAERESLRLDWHADAVLRTGLRAQELASLLRARLESPWPHFHAALAGETRMPVRLVAEGADGQELTALLRAPLERQSEGALRLADVAEARAVREPPAVEREDQQYKRYIEIFYRGPGRMGRELVDRELAGFQPPPGYRLERPEVTFFTLETQREFLLLLLGTVGLVFLVIAAVLESWRLAGSVLLCLPLAWIGIAAGFLWSGENFAEGAFLGSVLAIGLTVNAGILLADRFQQLRRTRSRTPARLLGLLALRGRLRPLWATTLTSVAGMIPALLPDTEPFWRGLAVTVAGGLLSSTLLAPAAMLAILGRSPRATLSPGGNP